MPLTDSELLDEIMRLLRERDNTSSENQTDSCFTSLSDWVVKNSTQGQKGQKTPRMNLAIDHDVYEYIRTESRKLGMTYSEFICAVMRQRGNFINNVESEDVWKKHYESYIAFKNEYGRDPGQNDHFKYALLRKWIHHQRMAFQCGTLSEVRQQKLVNAGFIFDRRTEAVWEENFELYKAFKSEFGYDPRHDDIYKGVKIGTWARVQKESFKKGILSDERKQKLSECGFFTNFSTEEQIP